MVKNVRQGRSTVYNHLTTPEEIAAINSENRQLKEDFLDYLISIDKSEKTVYQYKSDLNVFFVWNMKFNSDKDFTDIKRRDFVKFQKYCVEELTWSPARIRRVKSVISSLSKYIENVLDDEYDDFRNQVIKIESPKARKVRQKTVLSTRRLKRLLKVLTEEERYEQACAVAILAYSGMRKAELLQMREEYFDNDHLAFDGAMYVTDFIRTKGSGKHGKQLQKYILVEAKPYIDAWIKYRHIHKIKCPYLFVRKGNKKGRSKNESNEKWVRRTSIDGWNDYFSRIIEIPFYPHMLRHYCTTRLMSEYNLPAEVVQAFNGWEGLELLSIYNDAETADSFGKYFTANGIVKQEKNTLNQL